MLRAGLRGLHATQRRTLVFKTPHKDYAFLMDTFGTYKHYDALYGAGTVTPDLVTSILGECGKYSENTIFPLYQKADAEGCSLSPEKEMKTPKGFKEAWAELKNGGWMGLSAPQAYGGQGLPMSLALLKGEIMSTANWPFQMYAEISHGAISTLDMFGSEDQKKKYIPKMASGDWTGTMCLTESSGGSDLGQVKMRADPIGDGSYSLFGTKVFISCGDNDFADNVVHVVLGRLKDAPEGTKGLSLFVVPKYVVKDDGSLDKSKRNVTAVGIEHKMGIKGNCTCTLAFDGAKGWLVGKPNEGLKMMFTFMNSARLGVAIQGVSHCELAYQNSMVYAQERLSMRALTGPVCKDKPADPIIYQPDIRRMVLFQKAIACAGRALCFHCGHIEDKMQVAKTTEEREKLEGLLGFFTPIAKGCLTELGVEAASLGIQVWGGYGYVRENGMEQIMRDARIAPLYEGTSGIQAMDLIGRKVLMNKMVTLSAFGKEIAEACAQCNGTPQEAIAKTLLKYVELWKNVSMGIAGQVKADPNITGGAAWEYMMFSGYVTMGYFWVRMAHTAQKYVTDNKDPDGFYLAKTQVAQYYMERVLPRCDTLAKTMTTPTASLMQLKVDHMLR